VGDLTSHAYLADSKDVLYREVSDLLFDVDLSMANLECVVCPPVVRELVIRPDEGPALYHDRASFVAARGPSGEGFRFVAAACNHSLDFGEVGVDSTVRALEEAGIAYAELTARGADPCRATILERRGLRVGVVAYTFGLNAHRPPEDRPQIVHQMALNDGVAGCDFGQVTRQIEHCRSEDVDFIVAQLHWGLEHEHYPVPEQVELAHHLAELGVDAILGHHPHVVQPMELYRTKRDPRRLVPIYYSRGNLITPFSALHACTSYVARITIAKGAVGDEPPSAYVGSAEVVEVRQVADDARGQIRIVRLPRA
jgi:poly-gamma-glutamate synthesis protein (capsule biosynthesis protein)